MTSFITRAPVCPMYADAALRSEQVNQLVLGETADILETSGKWRRVRTRLDQYEGWVHSGYGVEVDEPVADEWRRDATGWSSGAQVRIGDALVRLPLRARVVLENGAVRLPDGRRGRLTDGAIAPEADATLAARAKAPERWALEYFNGSPYQWGGVTPAGVDCSGLVQTTFAARGVALPRDSSVQAGCGTPVTTDLVRPGDLLFFRGEESSRITHVAFAGEADTLIHSTVSWGGVLQEPWLPGTSGAPLRQRLVAARRLEAR